MEMKLWKERMSLTGRHGVLVRIVDDRRTGSSRERLHRTRELIKLLVSDAKSKGVDKTTSSVLLLQEADERMLDKESQDSSSPWEGKSTRWVRRLSQHTRATLADCGPCGYEGVERGRPQRPRMMKALGIE
jgi:hypothetical protein